MRNPWPIAVTMLCAGAFLAAALVAVVMIRQRVDLVVPDYYEQDLRHEDRMGREQRARQLARPPAVAYQPAAQAIAITWPDAAATGTVTLYRPSDARQDRLLEASPDANGLQLIPAAGLAPGLWRVKLEWSHPVPEGEPRSPNAVAEIQPGGPIRPGEPIRANEEAGPEGGPRSPNAVVNATSIDFLYEQVITIPPP